MDQVELTQRLMSEEARNKFLTEFLWRFGDHPASPKDLAAEARRLAHACNPTEDARPKS